jgi:hypothetical protein
MQERSQDLDPVWPTRLLQLPHQAVLAVIAYVGSFELGHRHLRDDPLHPYAQTMSPEPDAERGKLPRRAESRPRVRISTTASQVGRCASARAERLLAWEARAGSLRPHRPPGTLASRSRREASGPPAQRHPGSIMRVAPPNPVHTVPPFG